MVIPSALVGFLGFNELIILLSSILDLDFRILDLDLNVKFSLVLAYFQFKQKSSHWAKHVQMNFKK